MKSVRIGNGCGFWGDNLDAPIFLAKSGRLDYLTLEYLAELTMSILALQRQRDPKTGFAGDFLDVLQRLTPILHEQPRLKIITNAGGMNPLACAQQARTILDRASLSHLRIGVVSGDDLVPQFTSGLELNHLDNGESLQSQRSRVVSANAYLGAKPIVEALQMGASIVITGRVADASLTVAPAVHELGWDWNDFDKLSAGTVAGHLIECGAQMTGGLWCNWEETSLAEVGYPIAEIHEDGTMHVTKPESTSGVVNLETVSEQLLYEVADPAAYLTPDVIADFTSVKLEFVGRDVVKISQSRGNAPTDRYKVSASYRVGFTASGTLVIPGPRSVAKARAAGEMLLQRLRRIGFEYEASHIECLGAGDCVPGVVSATYDPPEVVLRVAVRDPRRDAVERFTKEFAPLVTSGPPGVTGYTTGRPVVREVFAYWPSLVAKDVVVPEVVIV